MGGIDITSSSPKLYSLFFENIKETKTKNSKLVVQIYINYILNIKTSVYIKKKKIIMT